MTDRPRLSVVAPAYNEEERIGPVLREFAAYFQREFTGRFQLVVILNGCCDNTLGVVQEAVEDGGGNDRIAKDVAPLGH